MADLKVSPDYLVGLSKDMTKWTTDNLAPSVAAVPVDWGSWTPVKIAGAATGVAAGGALVGVLGYNWSSLMAKKVTVKGTSFKVGEAYAVAMFAKTGYSIYSKLSKGEYYDAALSAVGLLPAGVNFAMSRTGIQDLLKEAKVGTPILDYADYVITGLTYACGWGLTDDSGEAFTEGAKLYNSGGAALQKLMPKSDWTGGASTQYAEVVKELQKLMGDVANADTQMAQILQLEQEQLDLTKQVLATTSKAISLAKPIALLLYFSPDGGPAKSQAFQIQTAATTLSFSIAAIGLQLNLSFQNAAKMDAIKPAYEAAQKAADKLLPGSGKPPVTPPVTPTVPTTGPLGPTIPLGSFGNFSVPVSAGAPRSTVAGPTTSGAWVDGGGAPDELGAPVPAAAPAGVTGGLGSGSGSPIAPQGGKAPRRSTSVKPDEALAAADETGAAEADLDPRPLAGAGVAGAERAPVDVTAAPEAREQPGASKPS